MQPKVSNSIQYSYSIINCIHVLVPRLFWHSKWMVFLILKQIVLFIYVGLWKSSWQKGESWDPIKCRPQAWFLDFHQPLYSLCVLDSEMSQGWSVLLWLRRINTIVPLSELQISCVFAFFTLWKRVKTHVLSDQSVHNTHTYCCVSKLSKFGAYLYSRVHNNTFLSLRNSL
jgi:hypothetical protein